MAKFTFGELIDLTKDVFSTKLTGTITDADVAAGFPMKLSADSTYAKCADGDEIEGFLHSVRVDTVDGVNFGGVAVPLFKQVTVYGAVAIGDYLVANTGGRVKKVADPSTHKFRWRYAAGPVTASGTAVTVGVAQRVPA